MEVVKCVKVSGLQLRLQGNVNKMISTRKIQVITPELKSLFS